MTVDSRSGTLNIEVGDSGKEIQVNDNLALLAALTVGGAVSVTVLTAPVTPVDGVVYIVPVGATGLWAGKDKRLAHYRVSAGWKYYVPVNGWHIPVIDQGNRFYSYDGNEWKQTPSATAKGFAEGSLSANTPVALTAGQPIPIDTAIVQRDGLTVDLTTETFSLAAAGRYKLTAFVVGIAVVSAVSELGVFQRESTVDFVFHLPLPVISKRNATRFVGRLLLDYVVEDVIR
jgi:hypothetical protein